jgi:hypothetical protein
VNVDIIGGGGPDWVAIIALAIAILSLLTTVVGGAWVLYVVRRRSVVPPPELADALSDLNDSFNDITAAGGQDTAYFLSEEQRALRSRLHVLAVQIVDNMLNGLVGSALMERHTCWKYSNRTFYEQQLEAADRGKEAAVKGIERCGALSRRAAGL